MRTDQQIDLDRRTAARKIERLRTFMIGSGLSPRGAERVIEGVLQAVHDAVDELCMAEEADHEIREIAALLKIWIDDPNKEVEP